MDEKWVTNGMLMTKPVSLEEYARHADQSVAEAADQAAEAGQGGSACRGWDQIRISLRHGGERKFHLARMSIPADVIVKRLREICGLPEPAPEQVQKV